MSGASLVHEDIVANILFALKKHLSPGCRAAVWMFRFIHLIDIRTYRYPDVTVVCGKRESKVVSGLEILRNPQMIIAVLSPSTEAFDRSAKFTYYKSIPSLTDYLLVATDSPYVTHYVKQAENIWINRDVSGMDGQLTLSTFGIDLLLSEVYSEIEFPERKIRTPEDDLLDR